MILVVILNYNQNEYTIKCVESLIKSKNQNFKILIIDNGSSKENQNELSRKLPKDEKVILKNIEENRGYVGGINFGLEEGAKLKPDYYLIMNNDTVIDEDAIDELQHTLKDYNNKAIVSGKVYHYDDPERLQFVGYKYINKKFLTRKSFGVDELDKGQYNMVQERDMLDDIFWIFPAELYKSIGGYSSYFWFNSEQADFALRAQRVGYKLVFTPKAKIWHKGSVSVGGRGRNPRLAYWTVQSSLILKYLHLNKLHFLIVYLNTLKSVITTFIKSIYYRIFRKENISTYALAKYKGFIYFNKWLIKKNKNTGYNPF